MSLTKFELPKHNLAEAVEVNPFGEIASEYEIKVDSSDFHF